MASVLIVEDSRMVMKVMRHIASRQLDFDLVYAESRNEAITLLEARQDWLAAIVDLNLPDAPNGELVDDVLVRGVPAIVLTASVDDEKRDHLTRKGIVDYVLKEGRYSYEYAVNLVNRLNRNRSIKVMVAEDSKVTRTYISELLSRYLFTVVEAENGQQALDAIIADDSIRILLTDYYMPEMDGFTLVHELRHRHDKTDIIIIGLSSASDKYLSAKFIKSGANDFLYKPFSHEEFACRIFQSVEAMERLDKMRDMAYTDTLTGIGNRRYFMEKARACFDHAFETGQPLSLVMLDIDHFKDFNTDYGHDVGDEVLTYFAQLLKADLSRFIVGRTGGEEFCVLMPGLNVNQAVQLVDTVRKRLEVEFVETSAGELSLSFSAGIAQTPADNVDDLLRAADQLMRNAKHAGRNRVLAE